MDPSKAFDTLNHDLLLAKLHAYGFDKPALSLVKSYLTNRWQRTKINNEFSSWSELLLGVPQGSILGPLLFIIYINDLFFINEDVDVCNFADDTTFYACDQDLNSLLLRLEHDSLLAIEWFQDNYMKLNEDKCHLILSGFKHQQHFVTLGGDTKIYESSNERLLGINIDNDLQFNNHALELCKKAGSKLSALARISSYMSLSKRRLLFKSFMQSQLSYCPLVWMFHNRNLNRKINNLHERALRIVYNDDKSTFSELLQMDGSLSIHQRNIRLLALEVYKFTKGFSPAVVNEIFVNRKYDGPNLRSQVELKVPKISSISKGKSSLRYLGPMIWNILPNHIKNSESVKEFKNRIKNWIPENCPCILCKQYISGVGYI